MGLGSNGVLRVRLSHALGLRSMDRNGFNDPYVKLTVGKKTVKSKTIRKTLNPRWDQVCSRSLLAFAHPIHTNELVCTGF